MLVQAITKIHSIKEDEHMPKGPTETKNLKVGDVAPDFVLKGHDGRGLVKLSDFKGKKNVFIAFYPLDWTPD
jgi:peroxiredoxin